MTVFQPTRQARAPYASDPFDARGRAIPQPSKSERSAFQRDKDRIIHSSAFRRLKGKTQVFVAHEGDYYRTRLTHSIEVSQIARSIARVLGLDEDLAECLSLAHDLGHPPFGHSGEDALSKAMAPYGGFDHNAQTLRIVTELEGRYAEFDGLNLTWETLEGIAKHNGPVIEREGDYEDLPWALTSIPNFEDLELHTYAGPEAQVAAISDDIAYINHDIDDGLRAGLFTVADIMDVPFVGDAFRDVRARYPDVSEDRLIHEAVRDMIGLMVADVLAETRDRLARHDPQSPDDIRHMPEAVCDFSEAFREKEAPLRHFLMTRMYRHYLVNRMMAQAGRVVGELFEMFIDDPTILPTELQAKAGGPREVKTARVVSDYISAMTDNYAIALHKKLFTATGYLAG